MKKVQKVTFSFGVVYLINEEPIAVCYSFLVNTATHPSLSKIKTIYFDKDYNQHLLNSGVYCFGVMEDTRPFWMKPDDIDETDNSFLKRHYPEYFL